MRLGRGSIARQIEQEARQIEKETDMARTIATNSRVSREELVAFLRPRHHAILMTTRKDGRPQSSPNTCGVDAEGRIVIASYPERAKVANIRRDPRVALTVLSDEWNGPWVQVDGVAEVIDLPGAVEPLVDYFRSISGEHPDWEEYRHAMREQGKCLIRVTIESWGPIATGGFPPRLAD
jgi:PPOX class probable F420-dependent enzyme